MGIGSEVRVMWAFWHAIVYVSMNACTCDRYRFPPGCVETLPSVQHRNGIGAKTEWGVTSMDCSTHTIVGDKEERILNVWMLRGLRDDSPGTWTKAHVLLLQPLGKIQDRESIPVALLTTPWQEFHHCHTGVYQLSANGQYTTYDQQVLCWTNKCLLGTSPNILYILWKIWTRHEGPQWRTVLHSSIHTHTCSQGRP